MAWPRGLSTLTKRLIPNGSSQLYDRWYGDNTDLIVENYPFDNAAVASTASLGATQALNITSFAPTTSASTNDQIASLGPTQALRLTSNIQTSQLVGSLRFDDSADIIGRTTNLPSLTSFTVLLISRVNSNRGSGDIQSYINFTPEAHAYLLWEYGFGLGAMAVGSWNGSNENFSAFTSRPAVGDWACVYLRCSGSAANQLQAGWMNFGSTSFAEQRSTTINTPVTATGLYISQEWISQDVAAVRVWDHSLSDAEILAEFASKEAVKTSGLLIESLMAAPDVSTALQDTSGNDYDWSAGGTLTLADGPQWTVVAASANALESTLFISGFNPNVSVDASNDEEAQLGFSSLSLTLYSPLATSNATTTPASQTITLTGYTPTVTSAVSSSVAERIYNLTLYPPTTSSGAALTTSTAQNVALSFYAPGVTSATNSAIGTGSITISNLAPSVAVSYTSSPGVTNITITGRTPTTSSAVDSATSTSSITLTGLQITSSAEVVNNEEAELGSSTLSISGYGFAVTDSDSAALNTSSLSLSGFIPTFASSIQSAPTNDTLGLTLLVPTFSSSAIAYLGPVAPNASTIWTADTDTVTADSDVYTADADDNLWTADTDTVTADSGEFTADADYPTVATTLTITGYSIFTGDIDVEANIGYDTIIITPNDASTSLSYSALPSYSALSISGYGTSVSSSASTATSTSALNINQYAPSITGSTTSSFLVGVLQIDSDELVISSNVTLGLSTTQQLTINSANVASSFGHTATLTTPQLISITGYAPSITYEMVAAVSTQSMLIGYFNPVESSSSSTSSIGYDDLQIQTYGFAVSEGDTAGLNVGALSITGFAPSYDIGFTMETQTSSIVLTGYSIESSASDTLNAVVSKGTLTLTSSEFETSASSATSIGSTEYNITEYEPTTEANSNGFAELDNTQSLVVVGYIPVVASFIEAAVGVANLNITPRSVTTSATCNASPSTANLNLAGQLIYSSSSGSEETLLGVGNLNITGFIPTISNGMTPSIGTTSLTLTQFVVSTSEGHTASLGAVQNIQIVGSPPNVASSVGVETAAASNLNIFGIIPLIQMGASAEASMSSLILNANTIGIGWGAEANTGQLLLQGYQLIDDAYSQALILTGELDLVTFRIYPGAYRPRRYVLTS